MCVRICCTLKLRSSKITPPADLVSFNIVDIRRLTLYSSLRDTNVDDSKKILLGDLGSLNTHTRLGNVAWEVLSFMAIADSLGRFVFVY